MGKPRVETYQDDSASKGWRWTLLAGNGEVVAQGESHTTEHDARRAAITAAYLLEEVIETGRIEHRVDTEPDDIEHRGG